MKKTFGKIPKSAQRTVVSRMLDYLYPRRCPLCEAVSISGICPDCRKKLIWIREDYCLKCGKPLTDPRREYCSDCKRKRHWFEEGRSMLSYQGKVRLSMYRFKYSSRKEYGETYGIEMAQHLERWVRERKITRIVPIPLHPSRKRQRGYNQAAILARSIGRYLEIPVDEKLLVRRKKTRPQKLLSDRERTQNLQQAFAVCKDFSEGEHILLVDDIYTTGSTADAAAVCLKTAKKCKIYIMTTAIGG